MQFSDDPGADPLHGESFYEEIDFPTEEELLAALENSLEQSRWPPRPTATALNITSRNLARRWQKLDETSAGSLSPQDDEHYLSNWLEDPVAQREVTMAPDFLAGLAKFLINHLFKRLRETYQVQHQLMEELAKLKG